MSWIEGFNFTEGDSPKPARSRFTKASALYEVYRNFMLRDMKDSQRRAKIRRINDGFLPYNPADLQKAGQAWRTNMNFKGMANAIQARADAVSRLAIDTCSLVTLSSVTPESAGPDDERITTVLAEELSRSWRRDGRIIPALAMMNKEADLYGIGPLVWADPDSYVPVALERAQICFDPDGPAVSSDHDVIFVDTIVPATTIFRVLENPELSARVGWNLPAVRRYAVEVFKNQTDTASQFTADGIPLEEAALAMLQRNDFYETEQFKKLHVLRVYVREMKAPRHITEIIVPANDSNNLTDSPKEFLFMREDAYDTMDQAFVWYTASLSQRYAKALRGIASTLAPISATEDRVTCAMIDATIRSMSLVLRQKNPGATPMNTLAELGPYTVIGADMEAVPNANQMSNFQTAIQVRGMLDQLGAGSVAGTSMAPTLPKVQDGDTQSKAAAEINEHRRTQRDENAFASRLHTWDLVFAETFRRFMKIATGPAVVMNDYPVVKEFVDRCAARGVDKEILREVKDRFIVHTCRDLVIGSEGIIQFLMQATQLSGNSDEAGRKMLAHDVIRYRLGIAAANRYMPVESRDSAPSNDASIATLENNCIKAQQPVLPSSDQRHYPHIRIHMQVLQEIQQQVEQGLVEARRISQERGGVTQNAEGELAPQIENPEVLAAVLQAASHHIQQHLQFLQRQLGVKDLVKEIQRVLTGLAPVIKALNLAIAEQRRVREAEQEKQQRELEDLQRRASEAETERAHYEADRQAETERYRIDKMHEVELAKLQMQGQEGQQRLAMEGQERAQRGRIDYEAARNKAMIESEQARQQMALRDQESRHGMALAEQSAASEARARASEAAAGKMANSERLAEVTGRQSPQPADFVDNQAANGILPL